jgi:hypothetical protein
MSSYLINSYNQYEDRTFVRESIVDAFTAVEKHVTSLEQRLEALEQGKKKPSPGLSR